MVLYSHQSFNLCWINCLLTLYLLHRMLGFLVKFATLLGTLVSRASQLSYALVTQGNNILRAQCLSWGQIHVLPMFEGSSLFIRLAAIAFNGCISLGVVVQVLIMSSACNQYRLSSSCRLNNHALTCPRKLQCTWVTSWSQRYNCLLHRFTGLMSGYWLPLVQGHKALNARHSVT